MNPTLEVNTPDGAFKAYIARPANLPAPAVVVVQEIFGVNADLRGTCDELAKQGYFARDDPPATKVCPTIVAFL